MSLFRRIKVFIHALFWGMRSADTVISSQVNGEEQEVNHKLELGGSVYSDMLQEKETQRVQEFRDATYRVFREADKYKVKLSGIGVDGENLDDENSFITAEATKKTDTWEVKVPHLKTNGYKTILIQGAKDYDNDTNTRMKEAMTGEGIDSLDSLIFKIEYKDGVTPKFHVERYIQKIVIKENTNGEYLADLYFSEYARQFVKRDSLFIAELNKIFQKLEKPIIFDVIDSITFVTDKAFGSENLHKKIISDLEYQTTEIFDGNFVVEFKCVVKDVDVVEKYKTKELDEKYKVMAPKHEAVDLMALMRKTEKEEENYNSTILKIEK
jgi:hypothetical protein